MPAPLKINPGDRFGRLVIVREVERRKKKRYFLCRCDCGNERVVRLVAMRAGEVKSCGCLRDEQNRVAAIKHGCWGTGPYWCWHSMKDRCLNPNSAVYHHYGGRGITVCPEWMEFEPFYQWAIENGYRPGLTLDRIDNNGNYEPSNCRWVTRRQQMLNTRRNKRLTFNGETKTLKEWADDLRFEYHVLRNRIARGWSVRRAFTTPLQHQMSRRSS